MNSDSVIDASSPNAEESIDISIRCDAIYDEPRQRQPAMSTFRSNPSIPVEKSNYNVPRGHAAVVAATTSPPTPTPTPTATSSLPSASTSASAPMPFESSTNMPFISASLPGAALPLDERRRPKAGILRLDINKPRRSSGGSVEFRAQPEWLGESPTSPIRVASPHQLSVTWAETCDINETFFKLKPMQECIEQAESTRISSDRTNASTDDCQALDSSSSPVELRNCELPAQHHLTDDYKSNNNNNWNNSYNHEEQDNENEDDEEDYSVSVSAIMQRRASVRGYRNKRGSRSSRRASSPMDHVLESMEARRRSSVYTSSSDEGTNQESTQEQIYENIRLHKEVIQSVKLQPWPIRKKLKLVRQAKTYVARHEGALQERFAMSRSTRDLFARFKILMAARWRHWKREVSSFLTVLIPWELRIKEIESHFGSGVASYFTFLRWLMWVNIMIAIPLVAFVIGPEYFATKHDETDPRKKMSDHEYKVAGNLFTIWEFEGYLKYSPMFYGYYSSTSGASSLGYKLPLAYFLTAVLVYIYSFVATLRKMAENSRNSKLSSKDDECTFSWKLFTGWDFMIGHAETAHNRMASVVVGFKESLLEEAEKKKDKRNWRIILQRVMVNILVMGLLAASGYTVVLLVNKSEELARQDNWLSRNAVNVTMTLLSFFLPIIFEALGLFENWHPRQQLRLQLARIMILNMLNLYSLMFSFIYKINSKERPLQDLKKTNESATSEMQHLTMLIQSLSTTLSYGTPALVTSTTTSTQSTSVLTDDNFEHISPSTFVSSTIGSTTTDVFFTTATAASSILNVTLNRLKCYNITVKCSKPSRVTKLPTLATTLLFMNLTTTTMLPPTTEPITSSATLSSLPTGGDTTWSFEAGRTNDFLTIPRKYFTPFDGGGLSDKRKHSTSTTDIDGDDTSTSTVSLTSTTPATPAGPSFFDFYDYFAGFPIDIDKDLKYEINHLVDTSASKEIGQSKRPTKQSIKRAQHEKGLQKRNVRNNDPLRYPSPSSSSSSPNAMNTNYSPNDSRFANRGTYGTRSPPTQRYGRGNGNGNGYGFPFSSASPPTKNMPVSNVPRREISQYVYETTTPRTYETLEKNRMSERTRVPPENRAAYDDIGTSRPYTSTVDYTTFEAYDINMTSNPTELWVPNAELPEVYAYFANSTTTAFPGLTRSSIYNRPSPAFRTPTTEAATDSTTTSSMPSDSSTPYFIDDDEVEDIGEPSYYDMHELNEGHFEPCVRTICEEVLPTTELYTSRSTELDTTTTEIALLSSLTPLERHERRLAQVKDTLSQVQKNLTNMCWETSLGQELSKVIVFDGLMGILAPLCIDFLRALFVRYVNQHWCWDMEKTFPQYGDFKIAENILTLIYNQGQVWMGIFFSPGLVLINLVKLIIMMYFRSWIVLTCNVPHEVVFKASKSNNFYLTLLLTMLFLCVLPVGYAIVWLRPSWHCGPFSDYNRIAEFITNTTRNALPKELHEPLDYLTSASTVIPLLLLLVLIIYYLVSLTGALREANQDLRTQLQKEREEERRKMFKLPGIKPIEPPTATLTSRWRKVLESSSSPITPTQPPDFATEEYKHQARKELISRIMKKALRKGSATSDEESVVRHGRDDDDTDTEHHDSLPHDEEGKERGFGATRLSHIRRTRKPSLVDIVEIAKNERDRERRALALALAAGDATSPTSGAAAVPGEGHSAGRLKSDGHDRKERVEKNSDKVKIPKHPASVDKEHDPDINSRIVSERRDSLMRQTRSEDRDIKKREGNEAPWKSNTSNELAQTDEPALLEKPCYSPPQREDQLPVKKREHKSSFKLINEKKLFQDPENPPTPCEPKKPPKRAERNLIHEGGKYIFGRQWNRAPDIFKFDERSTDKRNEKLSHSGDTPMDPSTAHLGTEMHRSHGSGEDNSPPATPSLFRHRNSEKLATLSRQGRKKIGSFLQRVREAAKKFEIEQLQQEGGGTAGTINEEETSRTTTISPPARIRRVHSVKTSSEHDKDKTKIDIPKDAAIQETSSHVYLPSRGEKVSARTDTVEDLEKSDQAGPITFPQRSASLRNRDPKERPVRQESQTSNWSDNIPTITISTTESNECVADIDIASSTVTQPEHPPSSGRVETPTPGSASAPAPTSSNKPAILESSASSPKEKIVKITIENDK